MTRNRQLRGTRNRPPSLSTSASAELLRRLELDVTRRLDGMLQGDYRGLRAGPRLRSSGRSASTRTVTTSGGSTGT
ncbi:MAG: hypothetical protein U5R31_12720 [Acidimicrobiia bacterium]|nr:hypothetical protein [Acidimicrobiia bacterium]